MKILVVDVQQKSYKNQENNFISLQIKSKRNNFHSRHIDQIKRCSSQNVVKKIHNSNQSIQDSLKSLIEQKKIIIQQQQRRFQQLQKQNLTLKDKISELQQKLNTQENAATKEMLNLNMLIRQQETQLEAMKHDKSEYEFKINILKLQIKQQEKQFAGKVDVMKNDFETQKQTLQLKINKLEKNLNTIATHYNVPKQINIDKLKLIQDANRDLRGFSNEKQERMIMIQNQQYANEIQFQAKEIQNLLQKNEKLHEQLKKQKSELELHKQIENDLVKRSSLAQKLIKQLNKRIRQLEGNKTLKSGDPKTLNESGFREGNNHTSQNISRISSSKASSTSNLKNMNKQLQDELNSIKFQYANLKNHSLYLENMHKVYTQKYETLGAIMADYLENLLYFKEKKQKMNNNTPFDPEMKPLLDINLDISALKKKDVRQWKTQELETVLFLLINQIKPFLSKNSLINFPQTKNINISFTEPEAKEIVSLPKIAQNYQKTYDKETNKINSRFKDIPLDISTKILRSNLREWGTKVNYGSNIPSLAKVRKLKSKSIASDIDRTALF